VRVRETKKLREKIMKTIIADGKITSGEGQGHRDIDSM
jgi:hypothetical protein